MLDTFLGLTIVRVQALRLELLQLQLRRVDLVLLLDEALFRQVRLACGAC